LVVRSEPQPDGRTPLSRERVLEAAVALADAEGIGKLSMRRLAHELGVEAMSLYHYYSSKTELRDAMLDAVYAEMEHAADGPDWRADMRRCALSARDTLLRHEWACELIGQPTNPSQAQLEWMNSVLGRLRRAGFSPNMTHHAYHALDSHIVGFVLWALPYVRITRDQPEFAQNFLASFRPTGLPYLMEHIEQHMGDRPDDTSEFEFGLELLLDGLERLRVQSLPTAINRPRG
jgi:AcrR family transcriptional regulator